MNLFAVHLFQGDRCPNAFEKRHSISENIPNIFAPLGLVLLQVRKASRVLLVHERKLPSIGPSQCMLFLWDHHFSGSFQTPNKHQPIDDVMADRGNPLCAYTLFNMEVRIRQPFAVSYRSVIA